MLVCLLKKEDKLGVLAYSNPVFLTLKLWVTGVFKDSHMLSHNILAVTVVV